MLSENKRGDLLQLTTHLEESIGHLPEDVYSHRNNLSVIVICFEEVTSRIIDGKTKIDSAVYRYP